VRWQLNPLVELHWRGWGDESVAYERVSGQMVACDALEAALVGLIEAAPRSHDEIHAQLAADLGVLPSDVLGERLQAIIEDFRVRGWVEPAP
jgi:hypothetical protein